MSFQVKDHFYKKAKEDNYLARSVYKLEENQKKFRIMSKKDSVLDLGYFPGSWTQLALKVVGPKGSVYGIDIQGVNQKLLGPINLILLQKDIFSIKFLSDLGKEGPFDVVLSDMAPATTGVKLVDQSRSLDLVTSVFDLLPIFLKKDGGFVIKIFEGPDSQRFLKMQSKKFRKLSFFRPKSTRSTSKEVFVIGQGYIG